MNKKMALIGGLYVERNIKCKPTNVCMIIFMLCLSIRFVEYFLIETDKTAIGENVLHKVVGIILLALVLKKINLTWGDIGFQKKRFCKRCFERLVIGKRVLCRFFWIGIGNFSPAGQSRSFGNLYQQFFFNWLADKKYGFCFLSVMRTVQCYQCMDGGRRFSRSVFVNLPNAFVTYILKYEQFPVMRASSTIAAVVTLVLIGLILLLYRNADRRIRRQ